MIFVRTVKPKKSVQSHHIEHTRKNYHCKSTPVPPSLLHALSDLPLPLGHRGFFSEEGDHIILGAREGHAQFACRAWLGGGPEEAFQRPLRPLEQLLQPLGSLPGGLQAAALQQEDVDRALGLHRRRRMPCADPFLLCPAAQKASREICGKTKIKTQRQKKLNGWKCVNRIWASLIVCFSEELIKQRMK